MAWSGVAMAAMLLVVGVASSPAFVPIPSTELQPPKVEGETELATKTTNPISDEPKSYHLFLINVFAIKNFTAEDSNDVLHDDVIKEVPDDIAEPLAMFLLVVESDDESKVVSLDEVAKDLVEEGFTIEKVKKDGETHVLKVDLNSVVSNSIEDNKDDGVLSEVDDSNRLMKLRRRRSTCLNCHEEFLRSKRHLHRHGHGGGGCSGGCGGGIGGGYQPYPQPQPVYPRPQPVYPQYYPQPCTTCGNNGGGGGGGYGNSGGSANAYASASAQASASSYGGY